jgi:hypothetical protein
VVPDPPGRAARLRAVAADSPRTLPEALRVFLRHASPRILVAATLLAGLVRLRLGPPGPADLLPVAGLLLLWPLQEWCLHVYLLHFRPRRVLGRTLDFRVPRLHRAHHRDPWRIELLFIPAHSFLYSLPLVVGVWYAVTPAAALAWTGITLHFALALHYEWVHFLVHTRVVPRSRAYRRLWRNHRLHLFKSERYWFGVSMLSGDRWLRTAPDPARVSPSPTCHDLGVPAAPA